MSTKSNFDQIITEICENINPIQNYPKQGVVFRDISNLLANCTLFNYTIEFMTTMILNDPQMKMVKIDYIAGFESRGFLFSQLASKLGCGFVMLRKPNKLPNCVSIKYEKEYGFDELCISKDVIPCGSNVLLVDDLIATGGTVYAGCDLIRAIGSNPIGCVSLIQLLGLPLNEKLIDQQIQLFSLVKYQFDSTSKVPNFINTYAETNNKINFEHKLEQLQYVPIDLASKSGEFEQIVDMFDTIVFYHPNLKTLGENYIANNLNCRNGSILWNKFNDGQPNITFEHMDQLVNKKIVFIISLFDKSILFEQISILMVLPRQLIKSLNIYIPYFAVGTMERVDHEGILATAETMAKIISNCVHSTQEGPPIVHIWDIHALPIRFYFTDNVIVKLETGIELLKQVITNKTIVVFPDDGSNKRFGQFFRTNKKLICSKVRDGDRRIVRIVDFINFPNISNIRFDTEIGVRQLDYDFIIIIDDLVQSGGTLNECRKALIECGYKNVCAYVTHSIFPCDSWKNFTSTSINLPFAVTNLTNTNTNTDTNTDTFYKFYTTNSVPEVTDKLINIKPFKVLKLFGNGEYKPITVFVGSHNQQKLQAVFNAMVQKHKTLHIKVIGLNVKSDIPEQPIGHVQTKLGCVNRYLRMKDYLSANNIDYDYIVSLENGLFPFVNSVDENSSSIIIPYELTGLDMSNEHIPTEHKPTELIPTKPNNNLIIKDVCVGLVESNYDYPIKSNHTPSYELMESIDDVLIPLEYFYKCLELKQNVTIGKIISKSTGIPSDSFHEFYNENKFTRVQIMDKIINQLIKFDAY